MKAVTIALLAGLTVCALSPATAVSQDERAAAAAPNTYLAVFNRPGAAWDRRSDHREALVAHTELYRGHAERGDILVGGRFEGEPILGLSIFSQDVDEAAIRAEFEADPAVRAGVIAIEFRAWSVQMGGFDE